VLIALRVEQLAAGFETGRAGAPRPPAAAVVSDSQAALAKGDTAILHCHWLLLTVIA
jgi:hypothetical protein